MNEEERKELAKKELAKKRREAAKASMKKRYEQAAYLTQMTTGERFEQLQAKIDRLAIQGIRVFGSLKAYHAWMDKPYIGFDGKTPNELACDYEEAERVYEAMENIARGDLS